MVTGYIICAVMSYLGMSHISDMPSDSAISHDLWMEDDSVRKSALMDIASSIVDRHIDLATEFCGQPTVGDGGNIDTLVGGGDHDGDEDGDGAKDGDGVEDRGDVATDLGGGGDGGSGSVYDYTREVLSLIFISRMQSGKEMGHVSCLHGSTSCSFSRQLSTKTMHWKH